MNIAIGRFMISMEMQYYKSKTKKYIYFLVCLIQDLQNVISGFGGFIQHD